MLAAAAAVACAATGKAKGEGVFFLRTSATPGPARANRPNALEPETLEKLDTHTVVYEIMHAHR